MRQTLIESRANNCHHDTSKFRGTPVPLDKRHNFTLPNLNRGVGLVPSLAQKIFQRPTYGGAAIGEIRVRLAPACLSLPRRARSLASVKSSPDPHSNIEKRDYQFQQAKPHN
jgi:hypothetical protein